MLIILTHSLFKTYSHFFNSAYELYCSLYSKASKGNRDVPELVKLFKDTFAARDVPVHFLGMWSVLFYVRDVSCVSPVASGIHFHQPGVKKSQSSPPSPQMSQMYAFSDMHSHWMKCEPHFSQNIEMGAQRSPLNHRSIFRLLVIVYSRYDYR